MTALRYISTVIICLAFSCAHAPNYFSPSERVVGVDGQGNRLAVYPLAGPGGAFGEAKLWSRGATMAERDGAERAYVHVGFELHDTSGTPMTMQRAEVRLTRVDVGGHSLGPLPALGEGDVRVEPQGIARADLFFELPSEVYPRDVDGFELSWVVHSGERRYQQRTLFVEAAYYSHDLTGYVIYDAGYPRYWYYRSLGYCADPFCDTVYVPVPVTAHGERRVRTRARPR